MHSLSMVFVLHAPLVFEQKIVLIPSVLNRNWFANILTIAKIVMHGTLCFAIENAAEPFCFLKKLLHQDRISFKNRRVERQFQLKTEGPMLWDHLRLSDIATLPTPLDLKLEYLDL